MPKFHLSFFAIHHIS